MRGEREVEEWLGEGVHYLRRLFPTKHPKKRTTKSRSFFAGFCVWKQAFFWSFCVVMICNVKKGVFFVPFRNFHANCPCTKSPSQIWFYAKRFEKVVFLWKCSCGNPRNTWWRCQSCTWWLPRRLCLHWEEIMFHQWRVSIIKKAYLGSFFPCRQITMGRVLFFLWTTGTTLGTNRTFVRYVL